MSTQPAASETKLVKDGAVKQRWNAGRSSAKLGTMHESSMEVSR
jgi:hypothetical protein